MRTPTAMPNLRGIYGTITYKGAAKGSITVALHRWNTQTNVDVSIKSATTNRAGQYLFTSVPTLGAPVWNRSEAERDRPPLQKSARRWHEIGDTVMAGFCVATQNLARRRLHSHSLLFPSSNICLKVHRR
jgi:hypothetical protein